MIDNITTQITIAMQDAFVKEFATITFNTSSIFNAVNRGDEYAGRTLTPDQRNEISVLAKGLADEVVRDYVNNPANFGATLHLVEFGKSFILESGGVTLTMGSIDYKRSEIYLTLSKKTIKLLK